MPDTLTYTEEEADRNADLGRRIFPVLQYSPKEDMELAAIRFMVEILEVHDRGARSRILAYVNARFPPPA